MADISMCANETCPLREKCYRFMVTPEGKYQCYADFEWEHLDHEHGKEVYCKDFWPLKTK